MEQTPYHLFIAFVRFDTQLDAQKKKLIALTNTLSDLEKQSNLLSTQLELAVNTVRDLKKQVDSFELELKDLRSKESTKKLQLSNASSPREYFSFEQELATLQNRYKTIDEQLFETWQQYETAQQDLEKTRERVVAAHDTLAQERDVARSEHEQLKHEIQQLEQERITRLNALPEEWKTQYLSMKERVENPVVPVIGGTCSGCFYPVSSPDLLAIKRHKLVACKECYRLLYGDE